jgi:hypothetical protein
MTIGAIHPFASLIVFCDWVIAAALPEEVAVVLTQDDAQKPSLRPHARQIAMGAVSPSIQISWSPLHLGSRQRDTGPISTVASASRIALSFLVQRPRARFAVLVVRTQGWSGEVGNGTFESFWVVPENADGGIAGTTEKPTYTSRHMIVVYI